MLVKGAATVCTCRKQFNKHDLTAAQFSDWPITMIGPAGLLLVVPQLFAIPVSVLWVGFLNSVKLNLDVKNFFAGLHTEHLWRCSKEVNCKSMPRR